jgi:AraC-like DNA-binding protein
MAIVLSQDDYWELIQENTIEGHIESAASLLDVTWEYPSQLGQGSVQELSLRDGLVLAIANYQQHDDIIVHACDREHWLEYTFNISTSSQNLLNLTSYHLYGSGIAPKQHDKQTAKQRSQWVSVHIEPKVFQSFTGNSSGQVPPALQHLVGNLNQEYYVRSGQATPAMQIALQQILQCPYQGLTRRMFLESKVLELMSLLLEHEIEAQIGKQPVFRLKPDDVERLHYAKEILHQSLDNPPSLMQLARQVGLNECTLKQGFRQMFNTTVFGYLRQCRMEHAKLLLMQGCMNVNEAAQAVGYTSQSRFAAMFRKTFGVNPKTFATQRSQ